jgi:hypothetical protein
MAVALYRPATTARSASPSPIPDTLLVRFGDECLIVGDASDVTSASRAASPSDVELLSDAPQSRLHLVVQLGRCFEMEHPTVPIVFAKGRYLVADIDHAYSIPLTACYSVRPLQPGETVFDVRSPSSDHGTARAASVETFVARIAMSRVRSRVERLAAFPTRHSTSNHFRAAIDWARGEFERMGYRVSLQDIQIPGGASVNLIAEKSGTGTARELFISTAHVDSVNSAAGPSSSAPGADDNATGCAGVLELAALLAEVGHVHDVRFILFGGEEQGLYGSRQYVARLSPGDRSRIQAVINLDMIGTRNGTAEPTVLIEGSSLSTATMNRLAEAAATYGGLSVQTSVNPYNSDHVPFIEAGISAVLLIEGTDSANRNVHTAGDTVQHIDYELMSRILTAHAAYLSAAAGATGGAHMSHGGRTLETRPPSPANRVRETLVEALRALPFQFSGAYEYEGGAVPHGRRTRVGGMEPSPAALDDPIYKLDQPVYLDEPETTRATARADAVRFSLAIDIDGTDPLNVVSGSVAAGETSAGSLPVHFVGRVVHNTAATGGRRLRVSDFEIAWPNSIGRVTQLEIELTGSALSIPTAEVTFVDSVQDRRYGPFVVQQRSSYFREVEVDVDRESGAIDPEPVSTHIHPDRPADLAERDLTLEGVFAEAGIRISRSVDGPEPVSGAGADHRWTYSELHDSMVLHWQAFANRPQWKMWIFFAERAVDDRLGGVMFDGDIDEPGGVDRQGTALFTQCPFFHTAQGEYAQANPPAAEAVKRELFFNLVHETGHAFNLAHSFQKHLGTPWSPPAWMPLVSNSQALSWMNYPDSATPAGGPPLNASWFYRRFRFRFDDSELLFLRHAPERYVQMGAETWFRNHARVPRGSIDPRLQLTIRGRKPILEQGEPVMLELKLANTSREPVLVHQNLDPSDGLVDIAITTPRKERRPFVPFDHTRTRVVPYVLEPGKEAVYGLADLTMGAFGFPFKDPGAYRIEASYTNLDGRTAAAVLQLYVRPAPSYDAVPAINELYDARIGRALYVEGTRVQQDVNDKMDWIRTRLADAIGEGNPIEAHLRATRFKPLMDKAAIVDPASNGVRMLAETPDIAVDELREVLVERAAETADTMGHIWYVDMVKAYTNAAQHAGDAGKVREARTHLADFCHKRSIVESVTAEAERAVSAPENGVVGTRSS